MGEGRVERRLAAILAADVVGYSRLMGEDEAGTLARLRTHRRELIDPQVAEHKGRIVKTTGDGILVEFASVVEAVACALAVQRGMEERNGETPERQRIVFRVGINLGDVIVDDSDIHGDGVNVAARLEGLAEPGGIYASGTVRDHIGDRLDARFDDLGEQSLKNIARPVRVYRVCPTDTATTAASFAASPVWALSDRPSLVVLPFQNMSGDPEQEYFADGMVEEITTAIARFPWLSVIARNTAFTYKGKAVDVKQVARELGVRYVLEGSVRKAGNRVRITGQLIDAATGAHLWADRFDGGLDDVFDLQDEVASRVVGAIEPRLRLTEAERVMRQPTESLHAYDLYLRATALSYKRTEASLAEAVRLANQALELDPAFVPMMMKIGIWRVLQLNRHWIPNCGLQVDEGIRMAQQAITAAGDNSEVLDCAGFALAGLAGDNDSALAAIDRAIVLNPNFADAFAHRALVLAWSNRPAEAIVAAEHAMRLSPHGPTTIGYSLAQAVAHLTIGSYEPGLACAEQAMRQNAGLPALRLKLSLLGHLGRREEASKCLHRMRETYLEPSVAAVMSDMPKGMSPEVAARMAEGLRKAGLP